MLQERLTKDKDYTKYVHNCWAKCAGVASLPASCSATYSFTTPLNCKVSTGALPTDVRAMVYSDTTHTTCPYTKLGIITYRETDKT